MNRRLVLTVGGAAGGLLTAAFLQAGAAFADASGASSAATFPEVPGSDAFTLDSYTFDPYTLVDGVVTQGWHHVDPLFQMSPFFEMGGGTLDGAGLATQHFDIYSTGTDPSLLGNVDSNVDVANLFGMTNTEFAVSSVDAAHGVKDSALPATGSVYDVFNMGHDFFNVYTDVPGATSSASPTITDTLVTPLGDLNLSDLFQGFDATAALDPGDAFAAATSGAADAGAAAADAGTAGSAAADGLLGLLGGF